MLGFLKSFSSNIHYNYSVQSRPSFEAGCWVVYDAKHKTTGEAASVFVMSKKKVAETVANSGLRPRSATTAEITEFATRGVQQLTKIRHPAVLKLVEPLEASKSSLSFVTERVTSTLEQLTDYDDLTVIRGLTTVVQALQFLHGQVGMVHHNITPQTVFIDAQGDWKLAGLEFLAKYEDYQPGLFQLPILDPRMPSYVQPPFDYLAPELVLNRTAVPANDVWSLAALIFAIYIRRPPMRLHNNSSAYREELAKFRSSISSTVVVNKLPASLHPYLASLFCEEADGRITLPVLETTSFFQNPLIKALKSMDDYSAKPVEEKLSFLKHFLNLLPQFPKQMRIRKIAKFACKELAGPRDPATATLMGNVLFTVCADMSRLGFQEQVLPVFGKLVDYLPFQESVGANLEVVSRNTNDKDFSKSVLPLLLDVLKHHDAQHATLQTQFLGQAHLYGDNLTVSKLEQQLFPSVIDCFAATPARSVKVAATQCLSVLVNRNVSKALITDRLIPALQAMKTRDPLVVVAVAALWKDVCTRLNSEQIFTLALPHLLDISLAKQLTVDQFKLFMGIIQAQLDAVAKEQVKLLVHNQPEEDDDWLDEVPTRGAVQSSGAVPSGAVSSGAVPSGAVSSGAVQHSGTQPAQQAQPIQSIQPIQPIKPTPAIQPIQPIQSIKPTQQTQPMHTPLEPSDPSEPTQHARRGAMPRSGVPLPAAPKPAPLPKTLGSVMTAQKIKELPKPTPALVPTPKSSASFPALQPSKPNGAPELMSPLVPTSKSSDDEFGSFVSSNRQPQTFDSLI